MSASKDGGRIPPYARTLRVARSRDSQVGERTTLSQGRLNPAWLPAPAGPRLGRIVGVAVLRRHLRPGDRRGFFRRISGLPALAAVSPSRLCEGSLKPDLGGKALGFLQG